MNCCTNWFKSGCCSKDFSLIKAIKDSWEILKRNIWVFLVVGIVIQISASLLNPQSVGSADTGLFSGISVIKLIGFLFMGYVSLGSFKLILRAYTQDKVTFSDLILSWRVCWEILKLIFLLVILFAVFGVVAMFSYFIGAYLTVSGLHNTLETVSPIGVAAVAVLAIALLGFLLRYWFVLYAIIDKQFTVSKALQFSTQITQGARCKLLWSVAFLWFVLAFFIAVVAVIVFYGLSFSSQPQFKDVFVLLWNNLSSVFNVLFGLVYVSVYKQLEKVS